MAEQESDQQFIAFAEQRRLARGTLESVATRVKGLLDEGTPEPVLIFDAVSGRRIDIDFSGDAKEVLERLRAANDTHAGKPKRGPGRPKLGVVGHEVTLLPRHWQWLRAQPGGASVVLRRLVDQARSASAGSERVRRSQEAVYAFATALAGDEGGYEEALRALFRSDRDRFLAEVDAWPDDVREHVIELSSQAFGAATS